MAAGLVEIEHGQEDIDGLQGFFKIPFSGQIDGIGQVIVHEVVAVDRFCLFIVVDGALVVF